MYGDRGWVGGSRCLVVAVADLEAVDFEVVLYDRGDGAVETDWDLFFVVDGGEKVGLCRQQFA